MPRWTDRFERFAVDVILERRDGKRATLLRALLYLLSLLYGPLVRLRLWLYRRNFVHSHSLGCLVISVGNLTVGGTGKTPVVEKLARELAHAGRRVAILSRGYKSASLPFWARWHRAARGETAHPGPRVVSDGKRAFLDPFLAGDEPYMLASNLQGVVVLTGKNRVRSGLTAIRQWGVDTLLLDDGFQYLPLQERIDIVLVDREAPFGNRFLLPRGTLREPMSHIRRADILLVTKCDGSPLAELKSELRRYNRHAPIVECAHLPRYLSHVSTGEKQPLSFLRGLRVVALSGIARPESFENGLRKLGAEIVYARRFADHHRFSEQELLRVLERAKARAAAAIVTTEKDAVRLPFLRTPPPVPIYFLRVEIEFLQGAEALQSRIREKMRERTPPPFSPSGRTSSFAEQPVVNGTHPALL
ncbi:tetraacyldisaccharide 4'-kinase [Methylacidimicrobium cyclopophantes]|uniref:Tetraacyldisaccharide 4'-kinase n=1 Tax=Methylacidimicrobium cyclopophantes TaxID=1041766 RepID=A0A5E6M697_9BACT|nr:tetraacyldisaccharide 4'-kinase [Methylacidimicrobium cyclopophantes]VVM05074.1 tetraacyldisaccharide 4'-kinase [Methylacidimicrobium cyclopophantes]